MTTPDINDLGYDPAFVVMVQELKPDEPAWSAVVWAKHAWLRGFRRRGAAVGDAEVVKGDAKLSGNSADEREADLNAARARAEAAEARVAELEAVITEARAAIGTENAWDGHARADQLDNTRRILSAAPTDSLNRVRAEALREAAERYERELDEWANARREARKVRERSAS